MFEKKVMEMLYRKAGNDAKNLPWHAEEPFKFLVDVVEQRGKPGKALDLGCGAGVYSVYLAKQGYAVTGLDFIPRALEMARQRANEQNVEVNWVEADLLSWKTTNRFDLVLDSGCLHTFGSAHLSAYKKQLLAWLAPGADFILGHWGKRHPLDWRPIGPRRRTREELVRLFSPELHEKAYEAAVMTGIALPIGPSALGQSFWFQIN